MKRVSRRTVLPLGAVLVAVAIWTADNYWGGGPRVASAAPGAAAKQGSGTPVPHVDLAALRNRLLPPAYQSVASELDAIQRDAFAPLAQFAPQPVPPEVVSEEPPGPPAPAPEEVIAAFRARHRLTGVMLGSEPLAVIDQDVVPLRSELDGFRMIEISRDTATFEGLSGEGRVTLDLVTPQPASRTRGHSTP